MTSVREQADIDRSEAVTRPEDALAAWADADPGSWSDGELAHAGEIASEQFDTEAWTRRH